MRIGTTDAESIRAGAGMATSFRRARSFCAIEARSGPALMSAVVGALCLALAACGTHSDEALTLVEPVATGSHPVDMLVVTTRAPDPDPGRLFSGERGSDTSFTELKVSIPTDVPRAVGEVLWPTSEPPDPTKAFAVVGRVTHTSESARAWFNKTGNGRALIFVHGFNTRYDEAVFRFAQFVRDSGTVFTPILFTWPSRGKVVAYNYDRESTNYSRDSLELLLRAAAADKSVKEISILSHSMGTWLTMETLRQMAIRDGGLSPKIHDVILASPDIDGDVFRKQMERIGKPRPRISLFVSRDDHALDLSKLISGDVDRLGAIDPFVEPWKSTLEKENVNVFDLTDVKTSDRLNHGKFAADGDVLRLIGNRLVAGQPITDAHVGLGTRVGGVFTGTLDAVGSVVTVPLGVLDSATQ